MRVITERKMSDVGELTPNDLDRVSGGFSKMAQAILTGIESTAPFGALLKSADLILNGCK